MKVIFPLLASVLNAASTLETIAVAKDSPNTTPGWYVNNKFTVSNVANSFQISTTVIYEGEYEKGNVI